MQPRNGAAHPPPPRQPPPHPNSEPPLHSHSPFPSAAQQATTASRLSRSERAVDARSRPAHVDFKRPATAAHTTKHSSASATAAPPPPQPAALPHPLSPTSATASARLSHSSHVSKQYDAASRGKVFCLTSPSSFLSLPTHPNPSSPALTQPFLILQLALAPTPLTSPPTAFSLHLSLLSTSRLSYRLRLSTAVSSVALHPFGADLPLSLPSGTWLNFCIPVRDVLADVLREEYGGVESVLLSGQCKVRRVFGMRHAPRSGGSEAMEEDEDEDSEAVVRYERRDGVPAEHDFEPDVLHQTLLYWQHASVRRRSRRHSRRRQQVPDEGREERAELDRQQAPHAKNAQTVHKQPRASATAALASRAASQWEESIEVGDDHVKPIRRTKRATQPLPSRTLAARRPDNGERPATHRPPVSYQMVPYADAATPTATAATAQLPASSPPSSRQLHAKQRIKARGYSADRTDAKQRQLAEAEPEDADADAAAFHQPTRRSSAATALPPSSSALPVRTSGPLQHAASSESRPLSPVQVRRPPPLIRTYTAPESIDVQHNVVGRERRDTRGEERREAEDDMGAEPMERANTDEVYRTSPAVTQLDTRLEQRQLRRRSHSRRKQADSNLQGVEQEPEQEAPQPQRLRSRGTSTTAAHSQARASDAVQHSLVFRPDLSSADSTPTSSSTASSQRTSRRPSLSSPSVSSTAVARLSGSELSSNAVSLSSTPFASLPASPSMRSNRPSLIAHAVTSHHSAPPSRRQSVQPTKEQLPLRQIVDEDDIHTMQLVPAAPIVKMIPPPTRTFVSFPPARSLIAPYPAVPASSQAPVARSDAVLDEPAANTQTGKLNLFSSPSPAVTAWPTVIAGPASPPPFSALRSSLPPFSFISKLTDAAPPVSSTPTTFALPASMPVSSTTSPANLHRPLSSLSQPVSPSPSAATDWARTSMNDAARHGRDGAVSGNGLAIGESPQERVLEEIEEEDSNERREEELDDELLGAESELEALDADEDSTRDESALMHEALSAEDTSLHASDQSQHSSLGVMRQPHSTSSPNSARVVAVSQHLRRLSMQDSSYDDERADEQREADNGEEEDEQKLDEYEADGQLSEEELGAASVPHFLRPVPASSTDTSFGSASFAAPVRSTAFLSLPSTSLVPMASSSSERPTQQAPTTSASTSSSPTFRPAASAHPLPPSSAVASKPTTTSLAALSTRAQPAVLSPRSLPAASGDLLVRYDPVMRAYYCPANDSWYELRADRE